MKFILYKENSSTVHNHGMGNRGTSLNSVICLWEITKRSLNHSACKQKLSQNKCNYIFTCSRMVSVTQYLLTLWRSVRSTWCACNPIVTRLSVLTSWASMRLALISGTEWAIISNQIQLLSWMTGSNHAWILIWCNQTRRLQFDHTIPFLLAL